MKDMRDIMKMILESEMNEADGNILGAPLDGRSSVNPRIIMDFFPTITNEEYFLRGWRKVIQNNEELLNRWELEQMGKAFVGFIRMEGSERRRLVQKFMMIHSDIDSDGETDPASFRAVNGPTPGLPKV